MYLGGCVKGSIAVRYICQYITCVKVTVINSYIATNISSSSLSLSLFLLLSYKTPSVTLYRKLQEIKIGVPYQSLSRYGGNFLSATFGTMLLLLLFIIFQYIVEYILILEMSFYIKLFCAIFFSLYQYPQLFSWFPLAYFVYYIEHFIYFQ